MSDPLIQQEPGHASVPEAIPDLLRHVGERIRAVRESKSISRQKLSAISNVSPRYLAQIEAGEGNLSIAVLKRISLALDCPMTGLLCDDAELDAASLAAADLFNRADASTRKAVMELLAPSPQKLERANRICLIGLRGAGKSTLGKMLAEETGAAFIELNREIEDMVGMPIAEIMALYGQEGFRKFEAITLNRIAERKDRIVLEAAGGVVSESATFANLLARFHTIWIKASPQEHMERVLAQGDTRPMAGNPEAMAQLKLLLKDREPLYAQALVHLDTSSKPPEKSLTQLSKLVREHNFLDN
ncbi:MAG: helix-turn-helix transcriptional regulator [Rhizobiaceae bacterium]|nr:helix-turn-helix transcriptional regulator [Rhizobiaceae bacterium]